MKTSFTRFIFVGKGRLAVLVGWGFLQVASAYAQVPTVTRLSPNASMSGGPQFTLVVYGTNFSEDSIVRWNGHDRFTSFFSSTKLTASIPAGDLTSVGTANVTVVAFGSTSNAQTFTISGSPVTVITGMLPTQAQAGSAALTLTVLGSGFTSGSVVQWNGLSRSTSFFSAGTLEATITTSDLATAGTADVSVLTGSIISNTLSFTITPTSPPPPATHSIFFPHMAICGGYTTVFALVNIGSETALGDLTLTNTSGNPFVVSLTDNTTPSQPIPLGSSSSFPITAPSGAARIFTASCVGTSDQPKTGWARVETSGSTPAGVATYLKRDGGILKTIAGVLAAQPVDDVTIPVDNDDSQGRYTGFAIANPGTGNVYVRILLLDRDGVILGSISPPELNPLLPQNQAAKFLHEYFPTTKQFTGSMALAITGDKPVIVALVQNQDLVTVIPVIPGNAPNVP